MTHKASQGSTAIARGMIHHVPQHPNAPRLAVLSVGQSHGAIQRNFFCHFTEMHCPKVTRVAKWSERTKSGVQPPSLLWQSRLHPLVPRLAGVCTCEDTRRPLSPPGVELAVASTILNTLDNGCTIDGSHDRLWKEDMPSNIPVIIMPAQEPLSLAFLCLMIKTPGSTMRNGLVTRSCVSHVLRKLWLRKTVYTVFSR